MGATTRGFYPIPANFLRFKKQGLYMLMSATDRQDARLHPPVE